MSFLAANLDQMADAAAEVAGIGLSLRCATATAAAPTTALAAAAGDEVSTALASLFSEHGRAYQSLSAQITAYQDQWARALATSAGAYGHRRRSRRRTVAVAAGRD